MMQFICGRCQCPHHAYTYVYSQRSGEMKVCRTCYNAMMDGQEEMPKHEALVRKALSVLRPKMGKDDRKVAVLAADMIRHDRILTGSPRV